ncbi:uncharacterized protein LOC126756966 [Bactrocera neohumeralis]|uniref:uncharacterized protein LOC126756966 n=1 Tax=Bactrocera neohumeralis TaxID=98809 RepID=UPI00216594FA|nr:uncharacterized protein LOC126756966 [Bactrocera neohumeralis]
MGDTQNELSQFGELEWTKCGEIKMCAKRNDFQLICVQCNGVFSQMAVFVRHLYWEHQLGYELQGKQQERNDLSIYTVEELLTNKNIENTFSDNENICNTTSDEDDTGFGSDEELEKEIQELLTSIATANSSCNNETEYSENVSSFEHKNMHGSDKNLQEKDTDRHNKNLQRNFGSEASKESDTADAKILPKIITIVSKNGNSFGRSIVNTKTNVEVNMNCTTTDPKMAINSIKKNNYTKEEVNCSEHKEKKSENAAQIGKKLPLKQYLESKKFLLQSDDESKSSTDWPKKNTGNKRKEVVSGVLKRNTNDMLANQNEQENLPNIGDIECVRSASKDQASNTSCSEKMTNALDNKEICIEKDCNSIFTLSEDLLLSDASNEEEDTDKKGNSTSVQDKETILMKTNSTEEKLIEIKYDAPTKNDFSSYHKAYISYLETNDNCGSTEETISQQSKSTTHEMDIEKPLDLSFNKSNEWADMELEEISELLSIDGRATTELITQELDKLLVQQQTNYTDNPTSLFNADQLQISDIVVDSLLPPFSKFFTNNENTLKSSNNFMTQSTPKEKNNKSKDLAIKTTKTNECISTEISPTSTENVENVIPKHKMHTFCRNLQRRFKISKRVTQCDENEKKSKKAKHDLENAMETMNESETKKKPDIEILSVDIILPNENQNQNASANFSNSSNVLPAENNVDDLQIPSVNKADNWGASTSESIIEDLTPYLKIEKPSVLATDLSSHAAADSTSEEQQPLSYVHEIDYTHNDSLNQLKLNTMADDKPFFNTSMESCFNLTLPCDSQNNAADDSMISTASEEERENYTLLCSIGLKIIMNPNAEDELNLAQLEEMRAKANTFAKIYAEFKYLWKFSRGLKSYEQLELDFNRLMQRLNEHYKFELTISQTKRIVNLISLWYMQTYHTRFMEKKRILNKVQYYLNTFAYLPKTARGIFYCEECPRYFLAQQKYFAHRQGHNALAPTCNNCQNSFTNRKELHLHTKLCATYKCTECAVKFDNAANLEYHVRNNHIFQCEKCGKLCATAADLDWHEHQYPIICGLCNRLYQTAVALQKHRQQSFHWDYACRTCEAFLPTATQMKQHLRLCIGNTM